MRGRLAAHTSKLVMIVATAPPAKSNTPATCVGVSTTICWPCCGPLPIVRSGKEMRAEPVTRTIGPSRLTSAVR